MKEKINNNYYNWNIKKGDYQRDHQCTSSFEKKIKREALRKRFLKLTGIAGLIILIVTAFAYWIF